VILSSLVEVFDGLSFAVSQIIGYCRSLLSVQNADLSGNSDGRINPEKLVTAVTINTEKIELHTVCQSLYSWKILVFQVLKNDFKLYISFVTISLMSPLY
jgi:hypothetical protein